MDPTNSPGFASLPNLTAGVDDDYVENLPDPDEDFVLFPEEEQDHESDHQFHAGVTKKHLATVSEEPEHILGTIIVRVVAARGLVNSNRHDNGGFFRNSSTSAAVNPYASVKFGKTTQRTSEVYSTLNPVWPRDEVFFMDVSLPVSQLTHSPESSSSSSDETTASMPSLNESIQNDTALLQDPYYNYIKPDNTTMTVAIFHTDMNNTKRKQKLFDEKIVSGDSDDAFLGMASIDLTRLFTGKVSEFDEWLPLTGTSTYNDDRRNSDSMKDDKRRASVRIVCEYEASDVPPKAGDICRFTRFCHPKDLYPLEPARAYKVDQVRENGTVVHLSYESQEGWFLSFQAHKNMLVCEERHVSALNTAQAELQTLGQRLSVSPLVKTVKESVKRVADDGVVGLAEGIVSGSIFVFDRWFRGGVDTVIRDIQDITNLDGRHNDGIGQRLDLESPSSSSSDLEGDSNEASTNAIVQDPFPDEEAEALPNMPACPITGFPMVRYSVFTTDSIHPLRCI